jgi:hypothetical protein
MEERTILEEGGVTVTTARIVIGGVTYSARNVGAVAMRQNRPGVSHLLIALAGFGAMFAGYIALGIVVVGFALCLAWEVARRRTVSITTGGRESVALWTGQKAHAQRVHDAVVQVISA